MENFNRSGRSPNKNNSRDDDTNKKPAATASLYGPEWRSVAIATPAGLPRPRSLAGSTGLRSINTSDAIDKESYFAAALRGGVSPSDVIDKPKSDDLITKRRPSSCNWSPTQLRPVPAFYPLERSSRFVEDELTTVVGRVSEANRLLSVHAVYCNETATASLLTCENVEMHLSLWKTSGKQEGIVIEIQRRKGDSITFHRYSRCILDAAAGELDIQNHIENKGEDIDFVYSKKVHHLLNLETPKNSGTEVEDAIRAVEIAHGLLMKDRMDARQLGLESLCLLTDPKKTGITTALLSSRVVLLGTTQDLDPFNNVAPEEGTMIYDEVPFQEIRQTILSLVQFRRIGDADEFDEKDDESEEEHITTLHNLALAVLANALDVIENEDMLVLGESSISSTPEEVPSGNRSRLDTSESISERFLEDAQECSGKNREIMKTLISELGKAGSKPHNACLSAKCIGSLCRASEKARKRAKDLGAKNVVQTALDVGTRTHLKLERECDKVLSTLTAPPHQNEE